LKKGPHAIIMHVFEAVRWEKGGEVMEKQVLCQSSNESLTLSIRRAAEMLDISEYLARRMAKNGELPTIKLGRLVRVPRARLVAMINSEPK
jgi:excisionase family DNA binding protein